MVGNVQPTPSSARSIQVDRVICSAATGYEREFSPRVFTLDETNCAGIGGMKASVITLFEIVPGWPNRSPGYVAPSQFPTELPSKAFHGICAILQAFLLTQSGVRTGISGLWHDSARFDSRAKSSTAGACGNECSDVTAKIVSKWQGGCYEFWKHHHPEEFAEVLGGKNIVGGRDEATVCSVGPARTANRRVAPAGLRQRRNCEPAQNGSQNRKSSL